MSYHEYDYESELLDAIYPMTDLDHLIAKYGTTEALKKLNKPNNQMDDTTTNKKCPDLMMVAEHGLKLTADPYRMKLIAEAISEYVTEHQLEDDTTLNDFRFNMETAYQSYHSLHEDDWTYVEEDREKVHGAF